MSLINDALKRAKATQPKGLAPAAGPSLHHVASERKGGSDILLGLLAAVILLLAGLLVWEWVFGGNELKVRANTAPVASALTMQPEKAATPVMNVTSPITSTGSSPVVAVVTNVPEKTATPAVAIPVLAEEPKPQAPHYKLQSIFYYAKNPSAVINGKTVFVGSIVSEVQVVAIGKDSATIMMANGQTKVLELP